MHDPCFQIQNNLKIGILKINAKLVGRQLALMKFVFVEDCTISFLVVAIQIRFLRGLPASYMIRIEEMVINEFKDSDTIRSQDNCCYYKL